MPSAEGSSLTSLWIRMAGEDGERAIDLFGAGAQCRGKAFGVAAEEDEFAGATVAKIAQPAREMLGGELFSGGVEQDDRGGGFELQFAQRGGAGVAQFADFDFSVVLDALDVVVQQGAGFFAAGLAEHDESDFHFVNTRCWVGAGLRPAPTLASTAIPALCRNHFKRAGDAPFDAATGDASG